MPSVKECTNDSEGEEMDQETPESEKTSNDDSDSSSGSEEDDSSEMDEVDCERRRSECIDDMADLERQFMHLKEQLYLERANQIEAKLEEVKLGRAPEYLQPLEDLQDNMRIRIEVAGILREMKLKNIKRKYDAEEIAAFQNLRCCKNGVEERMQRQATKPRLSVDPYPSAYRTAPSEVLGLTIEASYYLPEHDTELKARAARNKGVLVRQSLWSLNWYAVTRAPRKLVVAPAITYGSSMLHLSSGTCKFLERCWQSVVQRTLGTLGQCTTRQAVQGDIGWSTLTARGAVVKASYENRWLHLLVTNVAAQPASKVDKRTRVLYDCCEWQRRHSWQ
ncbi:hypothetical protein HPB48_018567 [Haemaphysalis longicornis]|uniref:Breast cancer metastasis-suppressor 1-like protein n=1 Tax=Haemaphysalis longicornis TaxID=44386 RepID=A0A9J6GKX1_HAELO|nr:hypothetical protein HPB48_018567 [Haemaphysalis longicornis]